MSPNIIVLQLTLPFLCFDKVSQLWKSSVIDASDVIHYICERFNLYHKIHFVVNKHNNTLLTQSQAIWDRIVGSDGILQQRIAACPAFERNPALRQRVLLSLKHNTKCYYNYHGVMSDTEVFTIPRNAYVRLFEFTPFTFEDRVMEYDHVRDKLVVTNVPGQVTVATVCTSGVVQLFDVKNNMDLKFLLPNVDTLISLYLYNKV